MNNYAAGISMLAFIVSITVSMFYYQFVYVPEANTKPQVAKEILEPPESAAVTILEGSSQPSQTKTFDPKEIKGTLGISNKIIWTNHDVTSHTVTSGKYMYIS